MVNMFCNLAKMFWCIDLTSSLNGVKCLLLHHINWGHFPPRTLCMKESTMLGIPTSSHSGRCLRNWQRIKRKRSCVSMEHFHCNRWTNNVGYWEYSSILSFTALSVLPPLPLQCSWLAVIVCPSWVWTRSGWGSKPFSTPPNSISQRRWPVTLCCSCPSTPPKRHYRAGL